MGVYFIVCFIACCSHGCLIAVLTVCQLLAPFKCSAGSVSIFQLRFGSVRFSVSSRRFRFFSVSVFVQHHDGRDTAYDVFAIYVKINVNKRYQRSLV